MLDADLPGLYGVQTKVLVQAPSSATWHASLPTSCVSFRPRSRGFEVTSCDLKHQTRRPAHRALWVHRARRGEAVLGNWPSARRRREHRDRAHLRLSVRAGHHAQRPGQAAHRVRHAGERRKEGAGTRGKPLTSGTPKLARRSRESVRPPTCQVLRTRPANSGRTSQCGRTSRPFGQHAQAGV